MNYFSIISRASFKKGKSGIRLCYTVYTILFYI